MCLWVSGEMGKGTSVLCNFPMGRVGLGPVASDGAVPGHKMHQHSPARAGAGGAVGPRGEYKTPPPFSFP